jgi:hypothetical protein
LKLEHFQSRANESSPQHALTEFQSKLDPSDAEFLAAFDEHADSLHAPDPEGDQMLERHAAKRRDDFERNLRRGRM